MPYLSEYTRNKFLEAGLRRTAAEDEDQQNANEPLSAADLAAIGSDMQRAADAAHETLWGKAAADVWDAATKGSDVVPGDAPVGWETVDFNVWAVGILLRFGVEPVRPDPDYLAITRDSSG